MVLLAVGIVGTMRTVSIATRASAQAQATLTAATLGQQILQELTQTTDIQVGSASGDFAPDNPRYRWESLVENSDEEVGLLVVTVTVYWPNVPNEAKLALTTMMPDPNAITTSTDTTTPTTGGAAGTSSSTTGGG